jgi:TetR/AcrR family transcriptional repressor of nem operon
MQGFALYSERVGESSGLVYHESGKSEERLTKKGVREKIVEAASRRFHEYGYNATGIQDIVNVAGCPKGSFYAHFKSKEALGLEVLATDAEVTQDTLKLSGVEPPLDRLREHFQALASDYYRLKYRSGCLIGDFASELSSNPKFRQATLHHMTMWSSNIAEVLTQAQKGGDVSKDLDAASIGKYLLDSFLGSALRVRLSKSQDPFEEFLKVSFGILLGSPVSESTKIARSQIERKKRSHTL